MKKIVIIILLVVPLITACSKNINHTQKENSVNRYNKEFKTSYYDGFIESFFAAMRTSLLEQGFKDSKVDKYIDTLRLRLNRKQLEDETWECVSQYTPEQLMIENTVKSCFEKWSNDYINDNMDAIVELSRP